MAYTDGRMYTCDRCGKTEFVPYTNIKDVREGMGLVRDLKHAPLEGWGINPDFKNLCPNCYAQWNEVVDKFMKDLIP